MFRLHFNSSLFFSKNSKTKQPALLHQTTVMRNLHCLSVIEQPFEADFFFFFYNKLTKPIAQPSYKTAEPNNNKRLA